MNGKLKRIFEERAQIYDCAVELFEDEGVTFFEVETMRGKNYFTVGHYNDHLFIRIDPEMENPFDKIVMQKNWKPLDIIKALRDYYETFDRSLDKTYLYYYYLGDKPLVNLSGLKIERIADHNNEQLITFLNGLTEEELELADIDLDQLDPVIFGGFADHKMMGYVSHRYPKGSETIGDIGIVVNADYRGNGYGRAMLIHEVNWCLKKGIIPMYVVLEKNVESNSLVQSLEFEKIADIYILK